MSSELQIKFNPLPIYRDLFKERKPGIVLCIGSRGSGKTRNVGAYLALKHMLQDGERGLVVRNEKASIEQSIFTELRDVFLELDTKLDGRLSQYYEVQERRVKDLTDGTNLLTQAGFRASSNAIKSNLKGFSGIKFAILEEADDIRDKKQFFTFRDSISRYGATIYILLNTPDVNHWIVQTFFDLEPTEHDGYFKLIPKKLDNVTTIVADYKDNPLLPLSDIENYKAYGDPNSSFYDRDYYLNQICGYVTSGRKGLVFPDWKICEELPFSYQRGYGLDFGFSNSCTALVEVSILGRNLYAKEHCYRTHMRTSDIINLLIDKNISSSDPIVCDSEDPRIIDEIRDAGFNAISIGAKDRKIHLGNLKEYKIHAHNESHNLQHELNTLIYAVDKDGISSNLPEKKSSTKDHLFDALKYICTYLHGDGFSTGFASNNILKDDDLII